MAPFRYATAQVIVHWLAAALIISLLATGIRAGMRVRRRLAPIPRHPPHRFFVVR